VPELDRAAELSVVERDDGAISPLLMAAVLPRLHDLANRLNGNDLCTSGFVMN
jgi:hypothetical protein